MTVTIERNSDLLILHQMEHQLEQCGVHFEAALVEAIGHDAENILDEG